jgi:hypothetical protein
MAQVVPAGSKVSSIITLMHALFLLDLVGRVFLPTSARSPLVLGIALTCLLTGLASTSLASIVGLRLSYTGDDATTVSWNTPTNTTSEVRYGTSPGVLTTVKTGPTTPANIGLLGFIHEVTLTGLQSDTTYYYVADSAAEGTSAEHSFLTRPVPDESCASTSFVFLGDGEPDPFFGTSAWGQIIPQAASHEPMFILHGGDMVHDSGEAAEWTDFLTALGPTSAQIPFMASIGNHDTGPGEGEEASYNQLFALPRSAGPSGSGTEDYYYFTAGNAIFVVLSTETFTGGATPFATQAAWLDTVLTENPRRWKFVIYHKPSYTYEDLFGTTHPPNEAAQNAELVRVIDAHHVDVVFSGHNHWYERYEPSACATLGNPGSDQPCSVGGEYADGTVYIVSGGAGSLTIPTFTCGFQPGRATCAGVHHYLLANIDNETLTLQTWAAFPETNEIIDSITIVKSPDCSAEPVPALPWGGAVAFTLSLYLAATLLLLRQHARRFH